MNILAIDTITSDLTITAFGNSGLTTLSVTSNIQHAEKIIDLIDTAMRLSGFSAMELHTVICAEGPGSFTGLRIAYSTAKALQLASGCSFLTVPPLLCYAHPFENWNGLVISVLDAKKNRFYAQIFKKGKKITDALDISETEILSYIGKQEKILVTGPDAKFFSERLFHHFPDLDITIFPFGKYGISDIVTAIAENRFSGYTENKDDYAGPLYVRKSDAETKNT